MLTAFTFPGQGAQRPGMLGMLPGDADSLARIRQAEAILDQPLNTLDTREAFKDTRNVQLALLISGFIWAEYLTRNEVEPDYVLGLSIGAYPAAIIAGCISFEDALRLVALRGKLMQEAFPSGYGMLALTGPQQTIVEQAVAQQYEKGRHVYLANLNSEQQFVLSGERGALVETAKQIRNRTPCGDQMLDVTVPSHCELLAPQAEKLDVAFEDVEVNAPECGYVSASAARVLFRAGDIRKDLARNMSFQMRWHESSLMLTERGLGRALEMPPGNTLTGLFRRVMPAGICKSISASRGV